MADPAFVWHIYPLGLLGADQTGADRTCHRPLSALADWLPHLTGLGCDTLLLGPVFASLSHGYDTVTHREIDDRLGDLAAFDALVAAASAQGVGVVLDGAFAYASREFWARDEWFLPGPVPWRVDSLITPDHASPGYRAYVADVLSSWLDRGASGWRLDSAWSVPNGFWRQVLARVRQRHPTAWFLGQVFDDDLPPVVNRAGYSCATEYALMHGARAWLSGGPVDAMVATLRTHGHNGAPHTFLGNHDFARLADVLPPAVLPLAFALLLTLPGVPGIYYGDEAGLTSTWTGDGDDALLRPALVPSDVDVLPGVAALGAFRRDNPWLTRAALTGVRATGTAVSYRVADADHALDVHLDPATEPVTVDVALC